ncbi:hypothetical protein A9X02_03090 [Mycobacterium malmoense]|nr:hypothetical protein A9X02_03090 [Mycobacterium malmoense]
MIVDGSDFGFVRRRGSAGVRWKRVTNTGRSGGDFAGDLLVQRDELGRALADIGGEGLCLSLSGGTNCCGHAVRPVRDRKILSYIESRRIGVLNRVPQPGAGTIQIRCSVAGYFGR